MAASRAIEPITAILALGVGQPLFFLTLWALAVHLAMGDIIFKDQPTLRTDLGITAVIGGLTAWRRANEHRVT